MALCDSYSGSHWLSLPFSGILWPSLAHYCSLILRIQSLIGSQGPCSTLSTAATLTHRSDWKYPRYYLNIPQMWSNMRQLYIAQNLSSCARPWKLVEAQLVLEEIQCGSWGKCASKRPHTWHTSALRNRFIKSSLHFVFGIMKIEVKIILNSTYLNLFRRHWIWSTFLLIVFLETTFHIA